MMFYMKINKKYYYLNSVQLFALDYYLDTIKKEVNVNE